MSTIDIIELARKFQKHELAEAGGQGTEYGGRGWAFSFRQLSPDELAEVAALGPEFFLDDNSNHAIWERVQDLLSFWEEWSYGEILEQVAGACDDKHVLSDVNVWEVLLNRMKFNREDYEFMIALLGTEDERLCYDFFQGIDHELKDHDHIEAYRAIKPGYDPCDLHQRLDQTYGLMETDGTLTRNLNEEL